MRKPLLLLGALLPAAAAAQAQGPDKTPASPAQAPAAAPPAAVAPAEAAVPVGQQAGHANGTVLVVNSYTPRRTSTVVNVTVTTAGESSRLNGFGLLLVDDQGGRYLVVPPADNREVNVPPNAAMEGDLVFSGRLNPAARALTLIVNERGGGGADNRVTNTPQFRVTLPVPQRSGALELPEDAPAASRLGAAEPIAPGLAPAAPLPRSRLAAADQAPGGAAFGAVGSGGAAGGGLGASRLSVVEQLRRELRTRQTERGELVSLPGDILFDFDRGEVRRDAEPTLRRLAQLIAQTAPRRVLVEGHTDSRGDDAHNRRLSERRAAAVGRWLAENGTPRALLATAGHGESRPVAPNARPDGRDDPEGRQRNRRVEVVLERA